MHILITGGAGFIGSNYVRRIVDGTLSGISQITVLDKLTYAGTLSNLKMLPKNSFNFVKGDVSNSELVGKLTKKKDAIINFAAESHVDRSITRANDFVRTNITGTQILLESAKNNGVKTFLQISTDEVYGTINDGSWDENCCVLPNSPYSATKASADLLVRSYHKTFEMDTRITRCSNNYGPHQFPEKLIPLTITNLMDGKTIPLYGNGLNVRDWIHVDDHCRGVHAALFRGKSGEIYNIGGNQEFTNYEVIRLIINLMGYDESKIEYVPDRLGHDFRYSVCSDKASIELSFKTKIGFESGVRETIDWYSNNEKWWRNLIK